MFCKNCGKRINSRDNVCPYCGEPQISERDGNGFWDIVNADGRGNVAHDDMPINNYVLQEPPSRKSTLTNKAPVFALVLSLLCCVFAVIYIFSFGRNIKSLSREVDDLSEQLHDAQALLDELGLKVDEMQVDFDDINREDNLIEPEADAENDNDANQNESADIVITKQPTSQPLTEGDYRCAFTVKATGTDLVYQWQMEQQGNWVDVSDWPGYNISSNAQGSRLNIDNAKKSMEGKYRCAITGGGNTVYSDEVHLTIQAAQTANAANLPQPDNDYFVDNSAQVAPTVASTPAPTVPTTPATTPTQDEDSAKDDDAGKSSADKDATTVADTDAKANAPEEKGDKTPDE